MGNLTDHMETYLGEILRGWSADPDGGHVPFQVAEFASGQCPGVKSIATIGLSNISLEVGVTEYYIRHEFVMLYRANQDCENLPAVLQQISLECTLRKRTFLRGEVIGPRGPLISGTDFVSLYVAKPVYFPEDFAVYKPGTAASVSFIWLFPITSSETEIVSRRGWEFFERRLEDINPDLADLKRSPISE